MKTSVFALAALSLGSLVAAAPLKHKRDEDIVWVTQVDVVTEVQETTITVWVDALPTPPPATAPAPAPTPVTSAAQFFEKSKVAPVATPAPATTFATSTSTPAAAPAPSSAPAVVAPVQENVVAPVQTTPVAAPVTTAAPVAPAPSPSTTPAAGGNQGATDAPATDAPATGATYTGGDITFYDPNGGYGSCGTVIQNSDDVVALPFGMMDAVSTKSNGHPWCGKKVAIYYNGQTFNAIAQDKCMGCKTNDIDLTSGLFKKIYGNSVDGRGKGLAKWSFV